MRYKASCPSCGSKISRWFIFCEPSINHRCRKCGARIGMATAGWLCVLAVVAIQIMWFLMGWAHTIRRWQAITLLLLTCGLTIWWGPYLISLQPKPKDNTNDEKGTA